MYVVASDIGRTSLDSSFDCFACETICRRRVKTSIKSTEITREYLNSRVNYCQLAVSNKINSLSCLSRLFL